MGAVMTNPAIFVTSPFARTVLDSGQTAHVPGSEVHAKTMGTTTTLCGRPATTWPKFWDLPFGASRGPRCPDCSAAVAELLIGQRDK